MKKMGKYLDKKIWGYCGIDKRPDWNTPTGRDFALLADSVSV